MPEIKVEAKVEQLEQVLDFVHEAVRDNYCSPRALIQLDVAVEELFVNIASYAYPNKNGEAWITADYNTKEAMLTLTLADCGIPYNPLEKEDPDITLSVEERQIGGLGIYMVKKTMDEITYRYEDGKNHLTIKKKMRT